MVVFLAAGGDVRAFVAGLQFFVFRSPPEDLLTVWFGANALAGLIGAPAIKSVALGCANIGIGPAGSNRRSVGSPPARSAVVLTGLVLARLRAGGEFSQRSSHAPRHLQRSRG